MSYLSRARKTDLITLVDELDLVAPPNAKVSQLCKIITEAENYDEEFTKALLSSITIERERDDLEREKNAQREFELKKLELESANKQNNSNTDSTVSPMKMDVTKLLSRYDGNSDISLYLALFERQVSRLNISKEYWVTYLLGLLPLEIANIIARESETESNDYDHIKQILLHRFKLTPEQFRLNFYNHRKEQSASWRDFTFELNNFFDEWISGLKISKFEDLKELMIVDQLKRKIPYEIRDHFIDDLPKITKIDVLVNKLEEYEAARSHYKNKTIRDSKPPEERHKKRVFNNNDKEKRSSFYRAQQNDNNIKCFSCLLPGHKSVNCPNGLKCIKCSKFGHKAEDCFTQQKTSLINNAISLPGKICKEIFIMDKKTPALCDTGSDLTIIRWEFYLEIGSPALKHDTIVLTGIGNERIVPKGFFNCDIKIDDCVINTNIYVLRNLCYNVVIGCDILNKINFSITENGLQIHGKRNSKSLGYAQISPSTNNIYENANSFIPKENNKNVAAIACETNTSDATSSQEKVPPPPPRTSAMENIHRTSNDFLSTYAEDINNAIDLSHILNSQLKDKLTSLITKYRPNKIKNTELKMNIILSDDTPISCRPRRISLSEQKIVESQMQEWLNAGIIKKSVSPFSSPIVLCKKKDGCYRICVDFRKINKHLLKDHFPMPLIDDILDRLSRAEVFSTLDLKNAFFHVDIADHCTHYTSFVTHEGQYEFLKSPFGLSTSPSVFQRYINTVFRDLIKDNTLVIYMDDLIVPATNEEEGLKKLQRIFEVAADYGLCFNFKKCQFLQREIEFLGYKIKKGKLYPSPSKTKAVMNFPEPTNTKAVKSFLGLSGHFRKFVKNYSILAKPLSDLLKKDAKFEFGPDQRSSFVEIKNILCREPVLSIYDPNYETELHTDASIDGYGAILMQKSPSDSQFHPVYYMSKKTSPTERRYSSYELEVLAVIEALKKFRVYVLGIPFKIVTDCNAFKMTMSKKDICTKIARWAFLLEEFNYEIIHRPGKNMQHVDALSRHPVLIVNRDDITHKIIVSQEHDEYIKTIKNLLNDGKATDYILKNNVLYKTVNDTDLLVVPESMQVEVSKHAHLMGHFAIAKTEDIVKRDFYFPNMRKCIENVVNNCIECILINKKRGKGEGFLNPIPKEEVPLSTYHIDFIGPLPSTNKNYNHIFTVIDAFSKFAWLYPVKTTSTHEVLQKLKQQQTVFGNPHRIITDRGSAFTSKEFKDFCANEGIEHVSITTGVPRGNGQIERLHGTIIPVLSKLSIENPNKWYKYVDAVQRTVNSTVSRSTKRTPFELLTGVKMRTKEESKILEILEEERINSMMSNLKEIREEARRNILKIQDENRKGYNKSRKKANLYHEGDLVAIQRTQFGTGMKLRPKFFGPYKITRVKAKDRYDVRKIGNHEGPNVTSTAADHMKPWFTTKQ